MREGLTQRLYRDFADLYRQHALPDSESLMCYGFECGDGWYDVLYEMSTKIKAAVDAEEDVEPREVAVSQVKEKLGGLRVYMSGNKVDVDGVRQALEDASRRAASTCERCGSEGSLKKNHGWLMTLCGECEETRKANSERRLQVRQQRLKMLLKDSGVDTSERVSL
ncbi:hypothetical protein PMZ80_002596 [Knufia obscura]|uniref:Uncharacterized protein n=1 Tax=Knufia obscura TaxID=1635080 RepID=A0ABR0RXT4_9EURO|nr:hypothetical protein PMZ80_002596 [Knufia obscura]